MEFFNPTTDNRMDRRLEVGCGLFALIMGAAGMFAMGHELLTPPRPGQPPGGWIVETGLIALGAGVFLIGLRMIRGPTPKDPNLLSPLTLYFGGFIFLIASPIGLLFGEAGWIPMGFALGSAVSCFYLANRRRKEKGVQAMRPSQWN